MDIKNLKQYKDLKAQGYSDEQITSMLNISTNMAIGSVEDIGKSGQQLIDSVDPLEPSPAVSAAANAVAPGVGTAIEMGKKMIAKPLGRAGDVLGVTGDATLAAAGTSENADEGFTTGLIGGITKGISTGNPMLALGFGAYGAFTGAMAGMQAEDDRLLEEKEKLLAETYGFGGEVQKHNGISINPSSPQTKNVQLEVGEVFVTDDAKVFDANTKEKHKDLEDDEFTDSIPINSYVLSDKPDYVLKRKDAELMKLEDGYKFYTEHGNKIQDMNDKFMIDFFKPNEDEVTYAELGKRIRKEYPLTKRIDAFSEETKRENLESRVEPLGMVIAENERKKTEDLIDELSPEELALLEQQLMGGQQPAPGQAQEFAKGGGVNINPKKYREKKDSIIEANKNIPWIKRLLDKDKYPALLNEDGTTSTHSLVHERDSKGNWYVFPTLDYDMDKKEWIDMRVTEDEAKEMGTKFPIRANEYAKKNKSFIEVGKDKKFAEWLATNGFIDHGSKEFEVGGIVEFDPSKSADERLMKQVEIINRYLYDEDGRIVPTDKMDPNKLKEFNDVYNKTYYDQYSLDPDISYSEEDLDRRYLELAKDIKSRGREININYPTLRNTVVYYTAYSRSLPSSQKKKMRSQIDEWFNTEYGQYSNSNSDNNEKYGSSDPVLPDIPIDPEIEDLNLDSIDPIIEPISEPDFKKISSPYTSSNIPELEYPDNSSKSKSNIDRSSAGEIKNPMTKSKAKGINVDSMELDVPQTQLDPIRKSKLNTIGLMFRNDPDNIDPRDGQVDVSLIPGYNNPAIPGMEYEPTPPWKRNEITNPDIGQQSRWDPILGIYIDTATGKPVNNRQENPGVDPILVNQNYPGEEMPPGTPATDYNLSYGDIEKIADNIGEARDKIYNTSDESGVYNTNDESGERSNYKTFEEEEFQKEKFNALNDVLKEYKELDIDRAYDKAEAKNLGALMASTIGVLSQTHEQYTPIDKSAAEDIETSTPQILRDRVKGDLETMYMNAVKQMEYMPPAARERFKAQLKGQMFNSYSGYSSQEIGREMTAKERKQRLLSSLEREDSVRKQRFESSKASFDNAKRRDLAKNISQYLVQSGTSDLYRVQANASMLKGLLSLQTQSEAMPYMKQIFASI